ncbi:MAG TPA: patatin-like phospholipase family protein [Bryobacteraceae bacterium]|nr:patatin-like phospholipase family protein [Bryobacteraceae bacterium]
MEPFKLGINMAGAISAGAYTAGVLDFLTEALDEWYTAKENGDPVPSHDISIEAFSGASAGGMCAAISACLLQEDFDHIHDVSRSGSTNKLYEAWVNTIDIRHLLTTGDLAAGSLISLLDSTIIESIADQALTPGTPERRKYVSPNLTLFLTLTNLRGVPYALFEGQTLTPDEYVTYHADRLRFETVEPGSEPKSSDARPLTRGGNDEVWALLKTAAMATGAFPVFLAPRVIDRSKAEYDRPLWEPICQGRSSDRAPAFPPGQQDPWTTVNVDGGVTNNSPFALAHDYLATLEPRRGGCEMEGSAHRTDRAVLTIAPFPGNEDWNRKYDAPRHRTVFAVLGDLLSTLIAQSRFLGESLSGVTGGPSFSRFFIAPSDEQRRGEHPLQCGLLGSFGGFFERDFRAHDFQLGRRNCQRFLETSFLLPESNPLFAGAGQEIRAQFAREAPEGAGQTAEKWLPVVPLVGSALEEVPHPAPGTITRASLNEIVGLIAQRANALLPLMIAKLRSRLLRLLIRWGARVVIAVRGKQELTEYLEEALEGFVVDKKIVTPQQSSASPRDRTASPAAS